MAVDPRRNTPMERASVERGKRIRRNMYPGPFRQIGNVVRVRMGRPRKENE